MFILNRVPKSLKGTLRSMAREEARHLISENVWVCWPRQGDEAKEHVDGAPRVQGQRQGVLVV
jgi:hypothetical protein